MSRSIKGNRLKKNQLKLVHKVEAEVEADENEEDRISELGDDILISIISRLTLKEATTTCVLSTRWRIVHARLPQLSFPPFPCKANDHKEVRAVIKKSQKYIKMIDQTVDSYKGGQMLKEFRVHMYSLKEADIQRWLEFALAREAEIIDIRLDTLKNANNGRCGLKLETLAKTSRWSFSCLRCLRELSLRKVDANDGDIKVLLSNSPNLESLSLEDPRVLRNVKMVGHRKLQRVNISYCDLESIKVENMINLVSLTWHRLPRTCVVRVNDVPKLVEFNVGDQCSGYSFTVGQVMFKLPSCILSQLLVVRLSLGNFFSTWGESLPELINVKELEIEWNCPHRYGCAHGVNRLIEACRSLEKFEMKINDPRSVKGRLNYREYVAAKECSPSLKKVRLSGYLGTQPESEFARFIIKYAAAAGLQELIIQLCDSSKCYRQMAMANVRDQLLPIVPASLNLVIL